MPKIIWNCKKRIFIRLSTLLSWMRRRRRRRRRRASLSLKDIRIMRTKEIGNTTQSCKPKASFVSLRMNEESNAEVLFMKWHKWLLRCECGIWKMSLPFSGDGIHKKKKCERAERVESFIQRYANSHNNTLKCFLRSVNGHRRWSARCGTIFIKLPSQRLHRHPLTSFQQRRRSMNVTQNIKFILFQFHFHHPERCSGKHTLRILIALKRIMVFPRFSHVTEYVTAHSASDSVCAAREPRGPILNNPEKQLKKNETEISGSFYLNAKSPNNH